MIKLLKMTKSHIIFATIRRCVPKIQIETRQAQILMSKTIAVGIDSWSENIQYLQLQRHFVRTLSDIGGKRTINEILLLENNIPHTAFSQKVLNCLPTADWRVSAEEVAKRRDLRDITICSVDPPGCTDIDDALHCRKLPNGNFEVGVHIADVTYFVRPGTALDLEAANRGTTVYLTGRASLTYRDAQYIIDDPSRNDDIAASLRSLNNLAKKLKAKRTKSGALAAASLKIRDTNSMVEELMLLANFSVAKKIYAEFAQCAVLRRHPSPPYSNFDPVLDVCKAYASLRGIDMNVTKNEPFFTPLENEVLEDNPYFKTMLHILTTRCMMQAQYFASGMLPENEFYHYGLAMDIYTHFTSPIRRYADVLVHRLLAMSIEADASYPDLLNMNNTQEICKHLNHRRTMAKYALRASISSHRKLLEQGYIVTVRKNALQVLVPKYGLKGSLYLDSGDINSAYDEQACTQTVSGHTFHIFDPVTVQVNLDSSNKQHQKLKIQLVHPKVKGLNIDLKDAKTEAETEKKTPRKKQKTKR